MFQTQEWPFNTKCLSFLQLFVESVSLFFTFFNSDTKLDGFKTKFKFLELLICFIKHFLNLFLNLYLNMQQKQPSIDVLIKSCSENMPQTYRRTLISKYDFSKVAKQLYWNHTSVWLFSCKFAVYFENTFF